MSNQRRRKQFRRRNSSIDVVVASGGSTRWQAGFALADGRDYADPSTAQLVPSFDVETRNGRLALSADASNPPYICVRKRRAARMLLA